MKAMGSGGRRSVLVVEDDADFAAVLDGFLTDHGFEVALARTFEEAADRAITIRPDLITLDLRLPGRSGLFLFHRLRSNAMLRDTPVIVITGLALDSPDMQLLVKEFLEQEGLSPPAAYLEKPLDLGGFADQVRRAIGSMPSRARQGESPGTEGPGVRRSV